MLLKVCGVLVLIFYPAVVFSAEGVPFSNTQEHCVSFKNTNATKPFNSDHCFTEIHNGAAHPITKDRLPIPWLGDIFYQALSNFTIQNDVGCSACETQTKMYIEHLRNNSYWAVKMYDSWSRYPIGILAGNTHQIGVYDECINVHQPVQGKYCMAGVKIGTMAGRDFELNNKDDLDTYDQAWNEILGFVDYKDRIRRNEVNIGICIPESCTATHLEMSLQNKLDGIFSPHLVQVQVKVEPIMCSTGKDTYPYDTGYYATITVMYAVLLMCCLSTLFHFIVMAQTNEDVEATRRNLPKLICWFSLINNARNLVKCDKKSELDVFHGIKVCTMIVVVFCHTQALNLTHSITYSIQTEKIYRSEPNITLTFGNIVDIFIFMSAYILYVTTKPQLMVSGTNWRSVLKLIVYKFIKTMPAYVAVIIVMAQIIPHFHNGPFWASGIYPEANKCVNYWWANILGISNLIGTDKQCLLNGWFVSCILQLMVIGTVCTYVYAKNRKVGIGLISLLLCLSLILPFILTYTTRTYGSLMVYFSFLENPSTSYEFRNFYMPFYMRSIPYCIGLIAGILVEKLREKKFTLSKTQVYIWTFIIVGICFRVQSYSIVFYDRHRPYNVIEQATYSTLKHCTWPVILLWITICHFTSGYGPIIGVINNQFMTVLGRLSYSVFLVNVFIVMILKNKQSTSITPTSEYGMLLLDVTIVNMFKIYITGLALYLTVEAPFAIILKNIFYGKFDRQPINQHGQSIDKRIDQHGQSIDKKID